MMSINWKFKHVQTFELIENENEWIVFSMKGKTCQGTRKYPPNIINKLKSVITYMFQLSVCRKTNWFHPFKKIQN